MLPNTLMQVKNALPKQLEKNTTKEIIKFFSCYNKNMWIYPGTLKRIFDIDLKEIICFLEKLEKEKILQSYYEIYCSYCQKPLGYIKLFSHLPEYCKCDSCFKELPALENTFIVYKVIKDN